MKLPFVDLQHVIVLTLQCSATFTIGIVITTVYMSSLCPNRRRSRERRPQPVLHARDVCPAPQPSRAAPGDHQPTLG